MIRDQANTLPLEQLQPLVHEHIDTQPNRLHVPHTITRRQHRFGPLPDGLALSAMLSAATNEAPDRHPPQLDSVTA